MEPVFSTHAQLLSVYEKLPTLVAQFEQPLKEAIRTAHAAKGITPQTFVSGLVRLGGTGGPEVVTMRSNIVLDANADPYQQLDLPTCLKYLCCGGLRIRSGSGENREYDTDQDAVFRYFHIPFHYERASRRPCGRILQAGSFSRGMLRLYSMVTDKRPDGPYSLLSYRNLAKKVRALIGVIQPLCDRRWPLRKSCEALLSELVHLHFDAMDAEAEAFGCPSPEELYRKGSDLLSEDSKAAVAFFQEAADRGHQPALLALGQCSRAGTGMPQDQQKALHIYRKLSKEGFGPATAALAECYLQGFGVPVDLEQTRTLLLLAGDQGHTDALNQLAEYYLTDSRFSPDAEAAFRLYTRSAQAGNAEGAYHLGECYLQGTGVTADDEQAIVWYQQAAEHGSRLGMFALGCCYLDGRGVPEDSHQAHVWFSSAAQQGMAMSRAMANAVTLLFPPQERASSLAFDEALSWVMLMANSGEAAAQYLLAQFYRHGIAVDTDPTLAFSWLETAVQAGSRPAVRELAQCLLCGYGTESDPLRALVLYGSAIDAGDRKAAADLAALLDQDAETGILTHALRRFSAGNGSVQS